MANPVCPTDCSTAIPTFTFSDCSPIVEASEITKIYIGKPGQAFAGPGITLTELTTRLGATGETRITELIVEGDLPAPEGGEGIEIQGSRGKIKVNQPKNYNLAFTMQQTNDANYQAMRQLQCGGSYALWYVAGGKIYGGLEGEFASININPVHARGKNSILVFEGTATWTSNYASDRLAFPLAA